MRNRIFSCVLCTFVFASACVGETFINLGPQVTATTIQGSEFLRNDSGRDLIYTVERGSPGHVLGYDVATGQNVVDLAMPGDCDGRVGSCGLLPMAGSIPAAATVTSFAISRARKPSRTWARSYLQKE